MVRAKTAGQLRQVIADLTADSNHPVRLGENSGAASKPNTARPLGQFHDALRDLAAYGAIRLSPWRGAMYQPQAPECCLLVGREIMAYATL